MIFAYFAISVSMYLAKVAEFEPIGSKPSVFSRSLTSGIARIFATRACSHSETSAGRFRGAHSPYQDTNSNPVTPDSATVGISGAALARFRLVRPSALILPLLASG